ncbi:MAG: single-stranded DNA-binding protein [Cyanophyceae cyanobacterium]
MSVNVVNLVGRAGRDPDVRYFENGGVLCKVTIAVDRPTKDSQADWFNLEIWGKTAEVAANYVRKGTLVGVQGSLKIDGWTDRATGAHRSSPVIRVEQLRLLGSRKNSEAAAGANYGNNYDEF